MKTKIKKISAYCLIFLIGGVCGYLSQGLFFSRRTTGISLIEGIRIIETKIDTLYLPGKESIKEEIIVNTQVTEVEKSRVRELPLDSGVLFLKSKLKYYDE